jgi:hypothetical protein
MAIKRDIYGREGVEKQVDTSWMVYHGPEAIRLGLTQEEMLICNQIGVTPEQFAASKGKSEDTKAIMTGKPLVGAPKPIPAKVQSLTKEQLEMCKQMGITPEQFQKTATGLQTAK